MPQTMIARGNEVYDWLTQTSFVWSSASITSTTSELTAPFPGVQVGDYVDMYLANAAMTTGLTVSNIRVSAANTLSVTWVATSGTFTIPTGPYIVNIVRPESFANLPATAV
jgi:hypothetical protein